MVEDTPVIYGSRRIPGVQSVFGVELAFRAFRIIIGINDFTNFARALSSILIEQFRDSEVSGLYA